MGGEPLATPPGFHFFVSIMILFTGMPLLLAQLITAAFFSSLIVFPAYLISKKIWKSHSAGILAAFFAAISALSLEMISWGGYTNVISLALIVILLYLFLRDLDHPTHFNLLMGAMLFGSIIITHTFSLFVFFPIIALYFISLLIGKARKLKQIKIWGTIRFFTVSAALGILIVSPWLMRVLNFYMGASSEGALLGGIETNKNIIVANRSIPNIILVLLIVLIPMFFMFRASRKKYIDNWSLLAVVWFIVPVVMTQSHLFGIFVDYSRFLYFIDFPGILLISGSLFYLARTTSIGANKLSKIKWSWIKKTVPMLVFTASLFIFIILSPWSIFPSEAFERVDFYTTIQKPEATAMEWIQTRTPENSVLVADHLYGWWLSGVAERTTLSAASLEFLLYSHEMQVAQSAQLLLDTDYYIDNGLIQVREDGQYISHRNPVFSIKTWTGEPYELLKVQDSETVFYYYRINKYGKRDYGNTTLLKMKTVGTPAVTENENSAILTMTRENDLFTVKKTLTAHRGVRFAELYYEIQPKNVQTNVYEILFPFFTREGNVTRDPWVPMFGVYDPNQKVCGQVLFEENNPDDITPRPNPSRVEMLYRFQWNRYMKIKFLVGVFDAEDLNPEEVNSAYYENAEAPLETVSFDPIVTWNYLEMVEEYDISFVACRDYRIIPKFSGDPKFRLVFKGGNIVLFQVAK